MTSRFAGKCQKYVERQYGLYVALTRRYSLKPLFPEPIIEGDYAQYHPPAERGAGRSAAYCPR